MPIFEYNCKQCNHHFEALVSGGKKARCPQCESLRLEQRYSSFAVGAPSGKGRFGKSASSPGSACGSCGDPRGPGSCSN